MDVNLARVRYLSLHVYHVRAFVEADICSCVIIYFCSAHLAQSVSEIMTIIDGSPEIL